MDEFFSYIRLPIEGHPIKTKIDEAVHRMAESLESCEQFDQSMGVFRQISVDGEIEATQATDNWIESAYNELADARRKIIGLHKPDCESFNTKHPTYTELRREPSE